MRKYHVVCIRESTGHKVYMSATPMNHKEACTFLSKMVPHKLTRFQLEED